MMPLFLIAVLSLSLLPHGGDRVYYALAPTSDSSMTLTVRMHDHDVRQMQRTLQIDIADHLLQHIVIKNNSAVYPATYIGSSETRGDAIWKFRVMLAPSQIDTLTVKIDDFVDAMPKVENVVEVTAASNVSYSLNAQRTSFTHIFRERTQHER